MGMLDGQVAIVTGASRGIGFAVAERLAALGASIAVVSTTAEHSQAAAEKLVAGGCAAARGYECDVSDAASVNATLQAVLSDFGGRVDILVNNAGITRDALLLRLEEGMWDQVLDVNLKGAYLWSRAVIRTMVKARYGRIVNMASVVGLIGNPGQANYAAAKAGMMAMGKSIAREVGSRNITVNMVAPGFVETDMTAGLPEKIREAYRGTIPVGRFAQAAEIANAVAFFVSPDAGYVTGQVLAVDGGMTMCG